MAIRHGQAQSGQISAVLLDVTMPLIRGEETLLRLRAIRPDVPVLLSSSYNEVEVIKRFTGQCLVGFAGKPYTAATLVAKVKSACAQNPGWFNPVSGSGTRLQAKLF